MSHFAKVEGGIVTEVLVIEQDVIDTGLFGDPALFVQTSYNTIGGQHPEGRPLRKNFAGIGFTYDAERDAFIPPQPYASWTLDEETCLWNAPVPPPSGETPYVWDENTLTWVEVTLLEVMLSTIIPAIPEPEVASEVSPVLSTTTSVVAQAGEGL